MTSKDQAIWEFWIDRGGTFTDIVARSQDGTIQTAKFLSENPESYPDAAMHGIRQFLGVRADEPLPTARIAAVKMGTTVATNALLERAGEPTVLVTTRGFRDLVEIGYQARPHTFALNIKKPHLLYDEVIEIAERVRDDGTVEQALDEDAASGALNEIYRKGFRAIAIALMHSYQFPEHEQQLARIAKDIGFAQISVSHEVSPLRKIVSRAETTIVDAYLTPILRRYIDQVSNAFGERIAPGQLAFMQSSGGLIDARQFRGRDAILSGPAGGIIGCAETARLAGFDRVIGFDMGGTSTDVSHYAGAFEKVYETEVAGVRMRVPMLDIHTVAAGGGSVLRYEDGRLRVGPQSAGADPGPACYRRGGPLAVTDINACLGKLSADHFPQIFGPDQDQPLDIAASQRGFAEIADQIDDGRSAQEIAEGFLNIAAEHMAQAIKKISIARGHDVKGYALNCFGGAGGQHACLVAERLGITKILLHPMAGVMSAYGIGLAAMQTERHKVLDSVLGEVAVTQAQAIFADLRAKNAAELADQGVAIADLSHGAFALLRYRATDTVIKVPLSGSAEMKAAFEAQHRQQFGFVAPEKEVLFDTLIVETSAHGRAIAEIESQRDAGPPPRSIGRTRFFSKGAWRDAAIYAISDCTSGHTIAGPAIITEPTGTIIVEPGWAGSLNPYGHLVVTHHAEKTIEDGAETAEKCDPVRLEIFNNLFMSIAEQMGLVLRNTSQSVNVKERLDFSCAIFDDAGNLVANAPHVPVHLGSMDASVKTIIASGQSIDPGDVFVQNNPHQGGSHLPDVTVVTPVFDAQDRQILFFVAARAHHEDIGGITPGSMSPLGTTIHEEGIVLDNIKLVEAGEFQTDRIAAVLGSGTYPARNIAQNIADLMAQTAANATGAAELRKLVSEYGLAVVHAYMGHIQDTAEAAVRRVIGMLEPGEFSVRLDSGARICVSIEPDRDSGTAQIDFTGTSAQLDNAFNAPPAVTHAAILYVFRCLVDDEIPLNAGCLKPLTITIPAGTLLNPRFPAAVVAGNVETSQAVTDLLFAALGCLGSGQGTMNNLTFGTDRYQYYETICSGAPAGPGFDGASGVHTHMTNTRMTDAEVLEHRYPVLLDEFTIDRGSGGKGRWNAGDGVSRRIRFLEDMDCAILSQRRAVAPFGMLGGEPGRVGVNTIVRVDGSAEDLGGCGQTHVSAGDAIVIETPTGGGFGPVNERSSGAEGESE
ncbi:MAG: hydantoinase B/oxoprolinase family protein [Erythrobacter sp.]